jgi:hypothetical protein
MEGEKIKLVPCKCQIGNGRKVHKGTIGYREDGTIKEIVPGCSLTRWTRKTKMTILPANSKVDCDWCC